MVVTREPYKNQGRITTLIENGKLFEDLGIQRSILRQTHDLRFTRDVVKMRIQLSTCFASSPLQVWCCNSDTLSRDLL